MGKYTIQVYTERCTGCLRCELACSDLYTKTFNPSKARIQVTATGLDCMIRFTGECNYCGVCVDHCFYDALQKEEKVAVNE
ncbi:MAG: 4Fe-4S binding protein [Deltaproteobacteria bacterium]|nr:4Fe-4S binding protein [Deltaproteobacteria bacterium]MBW2053681.1 4Fe-4S binding protein [Deltaproteobacteria bacterium]MBW2142058.1 4Fe-4S binding protein [Deltaproteobacteria bacterium]MBW2323979.1 4Fe-4S binding protein [Deltaproteobacteria bacterium]